MKERIIGAAVLVALAVVVVPVFLDGPPAGGEVYSERVPLPGQDKQASKTIVLERNRSEPVPAQAVAAPVQEPPVPAAEATTAPARDAAPTVVEPEANTRDSAPATAAPPAAVRDEPPAATDAARVSPTGMFAVQLGSFSSKENAEKLAAELRRQGFAAFLSQLDSGSRQLHRVRIGPQKDRQAAEAMAARLAKAGHPGQVVPHP